MKKFTKVIIFFLLSFSVIWGFYLDNELNNSYRKLNHLNLKNEFLNNKLNSLKNNPQVKFAKALSYFENGRYENSILICDQIIKEYYDVNYIELANKLLLKSKESKETQDYIKAKNTESIELIEQYKVTHPTGKHYIELQTLAEKIYFVKAKNTNSSSLVKKFIEDYPLSIYIDRALYVYNDYAEAEQEKIAKTNFSNNYQNNEVLINRNTTNTNFEFSSPDNYKPSSNYQSEYKIYRTAVGAICRDGWRSEATGRGACSHHGGVKEWIYN